MSLKAHEGRAKQWTFTIHSFGNETIKCLSTLVDKEIAPHPSVITVKVVYCAFAVKKDDNGKQFIEGYIKMNSRCRVASLVRLVGYGFFDTCGIHANVQEIVQRLKTNKSFLEFGNAEEIQTKGARKDLERFKEGVEANLTKEQLEALYPKIFLRFPVFANRLLSQPRLPLSEKQNSTEWTKVGKPQGLPWCVYKAWKKGVTYENPNLKPNKAEVRAHLKDAGKGLARKVFIAWRKGEFYLAA